MARASRRRKLSTTISEASYLYLQDQLKSGRVTSIAAAVHRDLVRARQRESRARLKRDSTNDFYTLSPKAVAEEERLKTAMGPVADEVNFGA